MIEINKIPKLSIKNLQSIEDLSIQDIKSIINTAKLFKYNNKIVKHEFNDFTKFNNNLKNLYKELNSKKFINILKKFSILKNYIQIKKTFILV